MELDMNMWFFFFVVLMAVIGAHKTLNWVIDKVIKLCKGTK